MVKTKADKSFESGDLISFYWHYPSAPQEASQTLKLVVNWRCDNEVGCCTCIVLLVYTDDNMVKLKWMQK